MDKPRAVPLTVEKLKAEQALVNKMTNWQRNQWARAGYPRGVAAVRKFLDLMK